MSIAGADRRFFESTRGRIVLLLRANNLTVNDLAKELGLTDNAVRAHLLSLERDGLVVQHGTVKGFRKPHFVYGLSANARELFPKPYGLLFNRLLTSLRATLSRAAFIGGIREIGRSIGADNKAADGNGRKEKLDRAVAALEALGGAAVIEETDGETVIRSESCPFAEAVAEHPEVCKASEAMVEEIVGVKVTEVCDRASSPKCRFRVAPE